jgi:hypothetical protein
MVSCEIRADAHRIRMTLRNLMIPYSDLTEPYPGYAVRTGGIPTKLNIQNTLWQDWNVHFAGRDLLNRFPEMKEYQTKPRFVLVGMRLPEIEHRKKSAIEEYGNMLADWVFTRVLRGLKIGEEKVVIGCGLASGLKVRTIPLIKIFPDDAGWSKTIFDRSFSIFQDDLSMMIVWTDIPIPHPEMQRQDLLEIREYNDMMKGLYAMEAFEGL